MPTAQLNDSIDFVEQLAMDPSAPEANAAIDRVERTLDEVSELLGTPEGPELAEEYEIPADLTLSVVVPVYNERKTLFHVLARINALPVKTEIIVVDDCSTDGTRGWLETIKGSEGLKLVFKNKNEGKGAALRTGFEAATGEIVVVQDADLEYDPKDILRVIRPLVEGTADVVYGSRFLDPEHQDPSRVHRLGNRALTGMSNFFTGLRLTDMETCYKAFQRGVLRSLELKQDRFGFEPEVTAKIARLRYRVAEVPISYSARGYAEGKKIGIRDAFNAFYCIVRYGVAD